MTDIQIYSLVISIKLTRILTCFVDPRKKSGNLWLKVRVPVLIWKYSSPYEAKTSLSGALDGAGFFKPTVWLDGHSHLWKPWRESMWRLCLSVVTKQHSDNDKTVLSQKPTGRTKHLEPQWQGKETVIQSNGNHPDWTGWVSSTSSTYLQFPAQPTSTLASNQPYLEKHINHKTWKTQNNHTHTHLIMLSCCWLFQMIYMKQHQIKQEPCKADQGR